MAYVVGALGSRPARSTSLSRSRGGGASARREPRGRRHAVDTDTGLAACGTIDALQVFDEEPWSFDRECCEECEQLVPFT